MRNTRPPKGNRIEAAAAVAGSNVMVATIPEATATRRIGAMQRVTTFKFHRTLRQITGEQRTFAA